MQTILFALSFLANTDAVKDDIFLDYKDDISITDAITRFDIDDVTGKIHMSTTDGPKADGNKELVKAFMKDDDKIVLLVQKGIDWTPTLFQAVGNAVYQLMKKGDADQFATAAIAYYDEFETEVVTMKRKGNDWRGIKVTDIIDVQVDLENTFALYGTDAALAINTSWDDLFNEVKLGTMWKLFKDAKRPKESDLTRKARLMRPLSIETRALLQENGQQYAFNDDYGFIAKGEVNDMPVFSLDYERKKRGLNVVTRKDGDAKVIRNVDFDKAIPANSGMRQYYETAMRRTGTDG